MSSALLSFPPSAAGFLGATDETPLALVAAIESFLLAMAEAQDVSNIPA
ncbi:hypothetical protein [Burkholderia ubonensis]|nr:hypothetical protein [Burkholderia ubonensis]